MSRVVTQSASVIAKRQSSKLRSKSTLLACDVGSPGVILSVGSTALGSGSVCRAHVLCLIPLNQHVSFLGHASARRCGWRSAIEIGIASSNIALSLLQKCGVVGDLATVSADPRHFSEGGSRHASRQQDQPGYEAICQTTLPYKQPRYSTATHEPHSWTYVAADGEEFASAS